VVFFGKQRKQIDNKTRVSFWGIIHVL
jgi:hypothetical protein